jgi:Phage integrase, N-terminal SAM-like domain
MAGGGRRRQAKRAFRTKKEAQTSLTEILAAHQSGTFVAPSRMPLREFVDPWLSGLENQGRRQTTLRGYRRALNLYVLPKLGDTALQDLRASDLSDLIGWLCSEAVVTTKGDRSRLSVTAPHSG